MARPREFDNLAITSIALDRNHLDRARDMGMNISEVCRRAIAQELNDPEVIEKLKHENKIKKKFEKIPRTLRRKIDQLVGEDPRRAEVWTNVINSRCDSTLTVQDTQDYVRR